MHALNRRRLVFAAAALFAAFAQAQTAPTVHLLVGYTAGGPVDTAARVFAPVLARELGAQVIVENKPGASGALAGAAVAKAPADGLTLFFAASPTITIAPHVQKKMSFDPAKELTPVAPVLTYSNVLVVNKDLPFRSVKELIAYAQAHPGKVFYGSAGVGASNHLSGELFAAQTKTQLLHVPYKGNLPAMTDVIGGQLAMMFDIASTARNFVSGGRVRALAVTSRERNPSLPEVPTMREAGLPDYEVIGWYGLYGPAGLPAAQVARLNEAVRRTLASDELRALWTEQGYDKWTGGPEVLAAQAAKDFAMWAGVTKGITVE
ncbi:MAG TPA: tripartite tricarboxylate transporter substrate-binding protein [Burkholderiaceae bacterium]